MVLEMEKQMRALNERMSRMLAADEEAAPVDTFFVGPFRRCAQPKWVASLAVARRSGVEARKSLRPKNKIYNPGQM